MGSAKISAKRRIGILPGSVATLTVMALGASVAAETPSPAPRAKPIAGLVQMAEAVPLPRPNPKRGSVDPIAALVAGASDLLGAADEPNPAATEDSDAPQIVGSTKPTVVASAASAAKPTDLKAAGLRLALKLLEDGDPAAATVAAYAFPDRIDTRIVDWLVATSGGPQVPSSRIAQVAQKLGDWPGQTLLALRFEQALMREKAPAKTVIAAFGAGKPVSDDGILILARAYAAAGRKADAAALVRPFWRDGRFGDPYEGIFRKEFGGLLGAADHKARMDALLYAEKTAAALRIAGLLDKNQQLLAKAVAAVIKQTKADKALAEVPASLRKEPIYIYASIQQARRTKKLEQATALMLSAPRDPALVVDGDAWWVERRLISRALIDKGDAKNAYKIAAGHAAESSPMRAEAEFHAGWYALEFLGDPASARRHFLAIRTASTMPLSQSRAEYWLGRAAEAAGDTGEASAQYQRAAAYPTTFYGQLALSRLGHKKLQLSTPAPADAAVRARFEGRDLVQVIRRLTAVGRADRTEIFYRFLAEKLEDPSEIALLAQMAEKNDQHQVALQIGKTAATRGLPCETLAFPIAGIPASAKTDIVGKHVVYAIARQESAFNHSAVSSAGARGLLQLMPATAKHSAKSAGLPFSQSRLTSDPAYNATLGATHLDELFGKLGGSYVMTFAAYNAGKSRVDAWVKAHGDPRDPKVDVVNWIELIPFTETRNYVQRTMENLQVYRARLGSPALTIEADLKRGKAG